MKSYSLLILFGGVILTSLIQLLLTPQTRAHSKCMDVQYILYGICIQEPHTHSQVIVENINKKCPPEKLTEEIHSTIIMKLKKNYSQDAVSRYLTYHPKNCIDIYQYRQRVLESIASKS